MELYDENGYEPEFEQMPVWDQLGIILDSYSASEVVDADRHTQHTRIITDDNIEFNVTPTQAIMIRKILIDVPVQRRREMFRDLQSAKGFTIIFKAACILEKKITK